MRYGKLAALALGATAALGLAACGSTHGKTDTITLTEPGGNVGTFGPIGRPTRSGIPTGSGFAFATPLVGSNHKTQGTLRATCIATAPSRGNALNGTCTGTATVPGGSLALNVGGSVQGTITGAIVGGTGEYAGGTGTFTSTQTGGDNGPMTDVYKVTLP